MKYLVPAFAFLIPTAASAASITLAPASLSVGVGETFTLAVMVQPASSTIASVSANISYDPKMLQETWFTYAPNWIAIAEPGYDAVDNAGGEVIKTAGYPGGITRPTQLGVITFKARSGGHATVVVAGDTLMLDIDDANQFAGNAGAAVIAIRGVAPAAPQALAATSSPPASALLIATSTLAAAAQLAGVPLAPLAIALLFFILGVALAYAVLRYWTLRRGG